MRKKLKTTHKKRQSNRGQLRKPPDERVKIVNGDGG